MLRENSLAAKIRAGDICDELAFEICVAAKVALNRVLISTLDLRGSGA